MGSRFLLRFKNCHMNRLVLEWLSGACLANINLNLEEFAICTITDLMD